MKKLLLKSISVILSVSFLFTLCSCSMISPENCTEHIGEQKCIKCGINYFDELASVIQSRATSVEQGCYAVEVVTDSVDCTIEYDESKNTVHFFLAYKSGNKPIAIFLLTMKPLTDNVYGWALYANDKMANGVFRAEDVTDIVFRPDAENNEFTTEEFSALSTLYEESVSFCIDALYALLLNNTNNLKISDLGFENYVPAT